MRDGRQIRAWMLLKGITGREISKATGIAEPHVSATIHGRENYRMVLQRLLDNGCPAEYLALPRGK